MSHKKGRERNLSFHRFPKETSGYVYLTNKYGLKEKVNKKKAWEKVLLMGKPTTIHMREDNFILPDFPTKIPRLKQDAVPSQNLPQKSIVTPQSSSSRNISRKAVNEKNRENEENLERLSGLRSNFLRGPSIPIVNIKRETPDAQFWNSTEMSSHISLDMVDNVNTATLPIKKEGVEDIKNLNDYSRIVIKQEELEIKTEDYTEAKT